MTHRPPPDPFYELAHLTEILQMITEGRADGNIAIYLKADAWDAMMYQMRRSPTFLNLVHHSTPVGKTITSFNLRGVEFYRVGA